ncbi:Gamma-glutamyl hydrolase [Merluccius polli]|uniref:folate gamma-glutamyl hydrolase n=1 Tax=Merluccius polli TaxID=89951 RepID=A0AA47MYV0_MERPO|nr:Gamma-glutamyl hydrolase [Merluccius polli]
MYSSAAVAVAVLAACLCGAPVAVTARNAEPLNDRPIIGVLAQENLPDDKFARGSSYIAACYVKYLESSGARVVPIRINLSDEDYFRIFNSINGLLLPGGDVDLQTSQFSRVSKIFYNLALKANDDGDHFPIWGTCQGFQQLSVLTANKNLLTLTNTKAVALPLTFTRGITHLPSPLLQVSPTYPHLYYRYHPPTLSFTTAAQTSRLFQSFPVDLMQSLAEENITSNFHSWSLSLQNFSRNTKLKRFYKILSTNTDGKTDFVSTMEALQYPFYAVQWHPEKSPFEWVDKPGMVHLGSAVRASFYTASFFISEAMKNFHHFPSPAEEDKALIYNFSPEYKGPGAIFVQNYYFN